MNIDDLKPNHQIAYCVLAVHGPLTKAELARMTGHDNKWAYRQATELRELGLVSISETQKGDPTPATYSVVSKPAGLDSKPGQDLDSRVGQSLDSELGQGLDKGLDSASRARSSNLTTSVDNIYNKTKPFPILTTVGNPPTLSVSPSSTDGDTPARTYPRLPWEQEIDPYLLADYTTFLSKYPPRLDGQPWPCQPWMIHQALGMMPRSKTAQMIDALGEITRALDSIKAGHLLTPEDRKLVSYQKGELTGPVETIPPSRWVALFSAGLVGCSPHRFYTERVRADALFYRCAKLAYRDDPEKVPPFRDEFKAVLLREAELLRVA
jgi:hypothetical protein